MAAQEQPPVMTGQTTSDKETSMDTDERPEVDPLLYTAWGVIANAGEGNWDNETPEWREAAERWRDEYHARLDAAR